MEDPNMDLSRIADGIERIANAIGPASDTIDALAIVAEVVSSETKVARIQGENKKCVTYTISSSEEATKFASMTIRFLLKEDPKWSAGQRIEIKVTDR